MCFVPLCELDQIKECCVTCVYITQIILVILHNRDNLSHFISLRVHYKHYIRG